MSVVKHFIEDSIKKKQIDEFLQNEFERAGYGGVSITKTPLGTHLVIYTMRPGMVIGRGGETIRSLATVLEEKFDLPSPQISVAEIEIPELNAYVVASRIASALKRGVHYRRAGFWGLNQTMDAGALGAEIVISGKLRTDRARYEKFRTGYLPKSGEPPRKYMRKAELHVHLKPGTLGVKVRLVPPEAQFPDQVQVYRVEEEFEPEPTKTVGEEESVAEEKVVESEVSPTRESVEETKLEPSEPATEEKAEPEKPEIPATIKKPVEKPVKEKKVTETKESSEKKKPTSKKKVAKTEDAPKKKTVTKKIAKKKKPASAEKRVAPKKSKKRAAELKAKVAKEKAVAKTKDKKSKISPKEKIVKSEKTASGKKKKVAKKKTKASLGIERKEAGK